jgi:transcriptional regulator with GAF, ATPase, and Fis domain
MSRGVLPDDKIKEGNDEIGEMAVAMNSLIKGLKQISDFAVAIGKGNFNKEFKPLSEEDKLGFSLMDMRDNLKTASLEEEKRKEEDTQRSWASNGIAMFSDILRKNNDNLEELAYDIITNLVKYLEINQGGLFMINDNDPDDVFIEMKGCYAYDRKKYLEKRVDMGVGLLGRCVQEKNMIYLTDVPEDYLNITSGIGQEKPGSILLVPMILNDQVFGVLELASFQEIEGYKKDFAGRLAESIASTIATVKTNMQTSQLLNKTRKQAEEMSQQEEEMRQNMEELQATQEESARREEAMKKEIEELHARLKD